MRTLIASLLPAVLSHLEAYAEVAGEDARDAATLLARKLAAILVAAAAAFIALRASVAVFTERPNRTSAP